MEKKVKWLVNIFQWLSKKCRMKLRCMDTEALWTWIWMLALPLLSLGRVYLSSAAGVHKLSVWTKFNCWNTAMPLDTYCLYGCFLLQEQSPEAATTALV